MSSRDPSELNRPDGNGWNSLRCDEAVSMLRELYVEKGLTQQEVADILDFSQHHVSVALREHGMETRSAKDYRSHPSPQWHPKGYIEFRDQYNGQDDRFYHHRLLAVAKFGFDAVREMDVHHKNGIGWANWEENIEILETSEHMSRERRKEIRRGATLEERFDG